MGVAAELDIRKNKISDVKNACIDLMTPYIPTCPEAQDFIDEELAGMDGTTGAIDSLKSTCTDSVNEQMGGINADFLNKCGGSSLLDLADTYGKKLEGVGTMAEGVFAAKLDEGITTMEDGVAALDPLDDCETMIANILLLILAPLLIVAAIIATLASVVADLVSDLVSFDGLQEAITGALVSISGLMSCGDAMFDSVGSLSPEVLALNPQMESAKSAVDFAKGVATDPADIINEAKTKLIADNGFDTAVADAKADMQSRIDILSI